MHLGVLPNPSRVYKLFQAFFLFPLPFFLFSSFFSYIFLPSQYRGLLKGTPGAPLRRCTCVRVARLGARAPPTSFWVGLKTPLANPFLVPFALPPCVVAIALLGHCELILASLASLPPHVPLFLLLFLPHRGISALFPASFRFFTPIFIYM